MSTRYRLNIQPRDPDVVPAEDVDVPGLYEVALEAIPGDAPPAELVIDAALAALPIGSLGAFCFEVMDLHGRVLGQVTNQPRQRHVVQAQVRRIAESLTR